MGSREGGVTEKETFTYVSSGIKGTCLDIVIDLIIIFVEEFSIVSLYIEMLTCKQAYW